MRRKFGFMAVMAILAVVIISLPAWGGETIHPQKVLRPTAFGITPPLRDITPIAPAKGLPNREVPNREVSKLPVLPNASPSGEPQGEGRITQVTGVLAPAPSVAFDGLNSDTNAAVVGFRVMPPDTEGAVGMNYYIQMINMVWAVYNKSDGSMAAGPYPLVQVWASGIPGTDCANYNDGDPVVLYDPLAQRWFMSQLAYEGSSYRNCLAVSQTGDPTGAWYVWQYTYSSSILNDYPKFGVWPDGYYMTVNEFGGGDPATTVFDRTAMLAGDASPAAQYFYIAGVQPAFPLPTNFEGGPPPPAGEPNYNMAFYDDAWGNPADILQICEFHVDWTTPANSTFTCPAGPGDPGYIDLTAAGLPFDSDLCGYSRDCIPQPNGQSVDTLCDRLMFPANYRNLMGTLGYEVMTVTHSVDVDGSDHAGVRWYELHNTGSGWFIYDGGSFAPDSDDRWMGSSSVDIDGNIGIIYSISSSTTYPSVGYTGRLATDPAGTMQSEQLVVAGAGSQSGGNRWGDYAAMHVGPTGCDFWGTAEYVNTGGNFIWDTYVASFSMPGCTPPGYGTLQGTVTSAGSGLPISGALVQAGAYSAYTESDGTYGMNIPADTYDVTASAFGFADQTVTGVIVPENDTAIQDFALEPSEPAAVDGYVMDAGGHDWPLYARVDVEFNSAVVATVFTDPANGYYEVTLPHSTPYDFIVTPLYPGYDPQTRAVVPPPEGTTENFSFVPNSSCSAPGYMIYSTGVDESFEGSFPPPGWTVVNHGGACDWNTTAYYGRTNYAGTGIAADADSDMCGSGTTMNTSLYTPVMDLTGVASPTLDYLASYNYLGSDYLDVNISSDGGATWTNLLHWNSDHAAYGPGEAVSLDVSAYATAATQVEFHFYAPGWDWWAEIDDLTIGTPYTECIAAPGALMVGLVTDNNTGEGINGATVMDDLGDTTTTMATPDDPNTPDGFYYLFAQLPGVGNGPSTRIFTASMSNYGMQQVQMNPQPNAANELDFALDAGWLEMTPETMQMRLNAGQTADDAMAILNYGGLAATVQMVAFETAGWVPSLPMDQINTPAVAPEHLNDRNAKAVTVPQRQPAQPLAAGDVIGTWPSGLSLPWGVDFDQFGSKVWLSDPYVPTTDWEYQTDGTATGNTIDLSS
ncbi:MAG: carboxypeptidase-like regulatory domain-containing protein, partial [Acidobacteria bacterium]|nr:carboxypeptidase-like regulatory domain-containing protein [Acidobacteriota bacterium]